MTIDALPQQPMPSHPRRRDTRAPLPGPAERGRLRRAWHLTEQQVAEAFGVTAATVRSWETGRTTPTGLRRAAYAAFLSGLAQGLSPAEAPPRDPGGARTGAGTGRIRRGGGARKARTERGVTGGTAASELPRARDGEGARRECPAPRVPSAPKAVTVHRPAAVLRGRSPGTAGRSVTPGPDPVSPARRRRLRVMAAAAGVWTVVLHLMASAPPPHG
ncbi:helix-turn-helix domain-containing protein [Streptomyces sp. NPDC101249]|uniref:helix-turn-helix domain-containing protein n=1 Tax=Streptomyces sp. NPDC101249 TaxID=3366140 RepID=UPI0038030718